MRRFDLPAFGEAPFGSARAARCRWCLREKEGGRMCQKCLLCQVDLLSELHFTECSQIFISLKASQRYEQARIHICHHCPFYRVRRFLYEDGEGSLRESTGAPFHLRLLEKSSTCCRFLNKASSKIFQGLKNKVTQKSHPPQQRTS